MVTLMVPKKVLGVVDIAERYAVSEPTAEDWIKGERNRPERPPFPTTETVNKRTLYVDEGELIEWEQAMEAGGHPLPGQSGRGRKRARD